MAVHHTGSLFVKSLLATALSAAVATTAFAQSVMPETDSNPISPSVQTQGAKTKMEYHRIGDGKPHQSAKKHHKSEQKRHHKHSRHGKGSMGHMRHAAIVIPGLGPADQKLVDNLKLTDEQKTKLQSIKDEQKAARGNDREAFNKYREERRKQLDSGNVDPKALLAAQKDLHDSFEQKRADDENKWLGLWDTFSDEQKATVVKYYKDRSDKWEAHRKQFEEKHAKMKEEMMKGEPKADEKSASGATSSSDSTTSSGTTAAPGTEANPSAATKSETKPEAAADKAAESADKAADSANKAAESADKATDSADKAADSKPAEAPKQ